MKTSAELRAFLFGIMAGIGITIGSVAVVSAMAGVKWQPVKIDAAL